MVLEKLFQVQFTKKRETLIKFIRHDIVTENQRDCILKLSFKDELEKGVLQQWEEKI